MSNCPLVTGLRPCECNLPRCYECGYTKHDAQFEMDHDKCNGTIPHDIWTNGFRDDGWPICPSCGEDEIYSLDSKVTNGKGLDLVLSLQVYIGCYNCTFRVDRP